MNGKMMDTEDSFIKCVYSTFNMTLNQSKFEAIERIKELNIDFMNWIVEFTEINKIKFPYIFSFFNAIISCYLKEEELDVIQDGFDLRNYITKARDDICTMIGGSEMANKSSLDEKMGDLAELNNDFMIQTLDVPYVVEFGY